MRGSTRGPVIKEGVISLDADGGIIYFGEDRCVTLCNTDSICVISVWLKRRIGESFFGDVCQRMGTNSSVNEGEEEGQEILGCIVALYTHI